MKRTANRLALLIGLLILLTSLWLRWTMFETLSAHGRYYFASVLGISGMVAAIALLRVVREARGDRPPPSPPAEADGKQRRGHYRVAFEPGCGPVFVQRTDQLELSPCLTCSVIDMSEKGLGLDCKGIHAEGQTVFGEVLFSSGKTAPVHGVVVRQATNGTFLRLHRSLPAALIMQEQRKKIQTDKEAGPLPAVGATSLDATTRSLPSHRPKGILRCKQS